MDGTLVLGDRHNHRLRPLPGALEITGWAARRGLPFVVFTNGTTRTPAHYARTMRDIGFGLPDEAMLTPASSAVRVFVRAGYQRVMVLGGPALAEPLRQAGLEVVPPAAGRGRRGPRGLVPEFTMPALEAACHAVWGGAELHSCSQTPFFAVDGGRALGTSRAISAMIRSLTGCGLRVVGKPSIDALRSAADRLGVPTTQLAVVGDDPQLEVPMAHRGRSVAIAVGTGLGGSASYDGLPVSRRPHLRVRGVDELLTILAEGSEWQSGSGIRCWSRRRGAAAGEGCGWSAIRVSSPRRWRWPARRRRRRSEIRGCTWSGTSPPPGTSRCNFWATGRT